MEASVVIPSPVHVKRPPFRSPERPEPQEEILGQSSVLGRLLASHYSQSLCFEWPVTSGDTRRHQGGSCIGGFIFEFSAELSILSPQVQDGP